MRMWELHICWGTFGIRVGAGAYFAPKRSTKQIQITSRRHVQCLWRTATRVCNIQTTCSMPSCFLANENNNFLVTRAPFAVSVWLRFSHLHLWACLARFLKATNSLRQLTKLSSDRRRINKFNPESTLVAVRTSEQTQTCTLGYSIIIPREESRSDPPQFYRVS